MRRRTFTQGCAGGALPAAGWRGWFGGGGIRAILDWYDQGKPRPKGRRIAFSLWRHDTSKDEPLLESGRVGPVRLTTAVRRAI